MRNNLLQEILVSVALIILLILFLNPFHFWMPNGLLMVMMFVLIVVFSIFASFVWRENARDEREVFHRMIASRIAFLVGSAILVIGIVAQGLRHSVDFWLVLTLALMIFAKIVGLAYSRVKH
jgi:hypothetical protein